jgi:hypothetical protein
MIIIILAIVIAWIFIQILKGKRDGFFNTPEQRAKREKQKADDQLGCILTIIIFILGTIFYIIASFFKEG